MTTIKVKARVMTVKILKWLDWDDKAAESQWIYDLIVQALEQECKKCAEIAKNIKSPKFTKSWNEACDEIAKEIRRSK